MTACVKPRVQTDNSHFAVKQCVRLEAIQGLAEVNVLDAVCGTGRLWKSLPHNDYLGIDKERKGAANVIIGDNRKIIPTLDLSRYNVIDLDAYGQPVEQLIQVYDNPTVRNGTIIIYTAIASPMSTVSTRTLRAANIDPAVHAKIPSLWNKHGIEVFFRVLAGFGVEIVHDVAINDGAYDKHYGYYVLRKNAENGIICSVSPKEDKPEG